MKAVSIPIRSLIDTADEMMEAELRQFQPELPTETPFDVQAALREISRSFDYDHSLELMRQVAGAFCISSHPILQTHKTQLKYLLAYLDSVIGFLEKGKLDTDDGMME